MDRLGPARLPVELRPGIARLHWLLRHWVAVGWAGLAAGVLVGGVGGRLFMRLSAMAAPEEALGRFTENGNIVGEITLEGTLTLVAFVGIGSGILGAMLYVAVEPWLAWARRWGGVVFGVFLFAVAAPVSSALEPLNPDFIILRRPVFNVAMIAALFIAYGVVISILVDVGDRLIARPRPRPSGRAMVGIGVVVGVMAAFGVLVTAAFFLDPDACGCDPNPLTIIALAVAGSTSLLWWLHWVRSDSVSRVRLAAVAAVALLVAAGVHGIQTIDAIASIL